MIQICKEAWGRAMLEVNYSERFKEWQEGMATYFLEMLWERSTKVGDLGETYNLNEISTPNQYKGGHINEADKTN
jgi:hypothetical protein